MHMVAEKNRGSFERERMMCISAAADHLIVWRGISPCFERSGSQFGRGWVRRVCVAWPIANGGVFLGEDMIRKKYVDEGR